MFSSTGSPFALASSRGLWCLSQMTRVVVFVFACQVCKFSKFQSSLITNQRNANMKRCEKHKGLGIKSWLLFPWFLWHGSTHQPMALLMLSDHLSHHANASRRWLTTDNHNILPVLRSNDSRVFVKKHIINLWKSSLLSTWTPFHLNSPDFSGSPNESFATWYSVQRFIALQGLYEGLLEGACVTWFFAGCFHM